MNIWIFNHYAITPDMPGGTRHYDLSRELVKRGNQVTIFATSFHHYQHKEMRLKPGEQWKVEDVDGIKFVWIRTPPYERNDWRRVRNMVVFMIRAWWLGRKLPRLISEISKPDVVIGSSVHLLAVFAAYWVAKHHKAKFVMEVRDLWPQTIVDMGEMSARHPIVKVLQALEKFLYHRAERIIILGPQMKGYISAYGVSEKKIAWIPNGVDLLRFDSGIKEEASHEGFCVMYLGAHGQANALDVIIKAAKIIQDQDFQEIKFVLVGDGPEKPRLMALARELGLNNVEFRESVPKAKVSQILSEAYATVFTLNDLLLYRYGISLNKLYDYLAAGKPLILAGNPVNNPVEESRCGLTVPPRSPDALAEAVIKLYQMPKEEREAMGRRGREYVEKYHDIRKLAERLEGILEEVLENGIGGGK